MQRSGKPEIGAEISRHAVSQMLAKTLAYHACGKRDLAAIWARTLVRILMQAGLVTISDLTEGRE